MKKTRLTKREEMIAAFHLNHMENDNDESRVFINNLIIAAIGQGWLEFDPTEDTVIWLGMVREDLPAEER
jgi:hypothetical protein